MALSMAQTPEIVNYSYHHHQCLTLSDESVTKRRGGRKRMTIYSENGSAAVAALVEANKLARDGGGKNNGKQSRHSTVQSD